MCHGNHFLAVGGKYCIQNIAFASILASPFFDPSKVGNFLYKIEWSLPKSPWRDTWKSNGADYREMFPLKKKRQLGAKYVNQNLVVKLPRKNHSVNGLDLVVITSGMI